MTCHCLLRPIRRDFTSSSYTTVSLINSLNLTQSANHSRSESHSCPRYPQNVDNRVTNCRGIALQPILSKALERYYILNLIEPYLSPSQHGFRRYRSCVTQLLHHLRKLATSLDAGEQMLIWKRRLIEYHMKSLYTSWSI